MTPIAASLAKTSRPLNMAGPLENQPAPQWVQMVLLHGFVKKTQKTPESDLDTARKRMKEVKK
jgi:hypothetical protein